MPLPSSRHEWDSSIKDRVVGAIVTGDIKVTTAARREGVPIQTARDWVKKFKATGSTENLPRSGRPTKLGPQARRLVVRKAQKARRAPFREIGNTMEPPVSSDTIRRILEECGYHRCVARYVPFLTEGHKKQRLAWGRAQHALTAHDWWRVIWSDECYIYLSSKHGRIYVTRRPDEVYHPDCLVPTFTQSSICVMVWGCIMQDRKGPIVALEYPGGKGGGMNSKRYREQVLEGPFWDFYTQMNEERGLAVFQQDGASMHTSKTTRAWLARHDVSVFPHPSSSPDMNPIEPVWWELKKAIKSLPVLPSSVDQLRQAVVTAWEALDIEHINKHTRSMPDRVQAILSAKGGHTPY
jgi:transposase